MQTGYGYVRYLGETSSVESTTQLFADGIKYIIAPCKNVGGSKSTPSDSEFKGQFRYPDGTLSPTPGAALLQSQGAAAAPVTTHHFEQNSRYQGARCAVPQSYPLPQAVHPNPHTLAYAHAASPYHPLAAACRGAQGRSMYPAPAAVPESSFTDLEYRALLDGEQQQRAQYQREVRMQTAFNQRNLLLPGPGSVSVPGGVGVSPYAQAVQFVPSAHVVGVRGPRAAVPSTALRAQPGVHRALQPPVPPASGVDDCWFRGPPFPSTAASNTCHAELAYLEALSKTAHQSGAAGHPGHAQSPAGSNNWSPGASHPEASAEFFTSTPSGVAPVA
jgi:hypothetical protein